MKKSKAVHLKLDGAERMFCGRTPKGWRDDVEYDRLCKVCGRHLPDDQIVVFVRGGQPFMYELPKDPDPRPVYGPFLFTVTFKTAYIAQLDDDLKDTA